MEVIVLICRWFFLLSKSGLLAFSFLGSPRVGLVWALIPIMWVSSKARSVLSEDFKGGLL